MTEPLIPDNSDFDILSSPWICAGEAVSWEPVLKFGLLREYRKHEVIIHAGQTVEALGYLKEGLVKTVAPEAGGQEKLIWFIESGCVLGETPLFNQKPCAYYFQAVQNSKVYWLSKSVVEDVILPNFPQITKSLLSILARKVHVLSTQVEDQVFLKPSVRVAKVIYLYYERKKATGWKEYPSLPVTQEDIANLLGLHRVTVNQTLQAMRSSGILVDHTHRIIVKNLEFLRQAACP